MKSEKLFAVAFLLAALVFIAPVNAFGAATITIVNNDLSNVGFNDPTPVAPVGGNTGTTLGQQRLIAFQAAANIWGATLDSPIEIKVLASWAALSCNATSAVLGSAGPTEIWRFSGGVLFPASWYHKALADKLAGLDLDPATPAIVARFNVNLSKTGCLTGVGFYLGLDNNHGTQVDLVTVLTHEFAHGLGFSSVTPGTTGTWVGGFPGVWDNLLYDNTQKKLWLDMTDAERMTSALNYGKLVWKGANVTANVPAVLSAGTPLLMVTAPSSVAAPYAVASASFGPPLNTTGVTGEIMPVVDTYPNTGLACAPLTALNAMAVNGKIAVVDRGTCNFTLKVKNCQNAGAIGVLVVDNVAGSPPTGLGGTDSTITIPAVKISLADGNTLKAALATRSRLHSGMYAFLGIAQAIRNGADGLNQALMYAPNPYQSGSSVSHYDVSMFPNQLMEPNINGDLTHNVAPPIDLTFPLLKDVGW